MMPGAGLYLPGMLSRSFDDTETRTEKPRIFGRKSSQDSDSDRKSIAISRASSEDVTRVFSSLKTVFDFADWASTERKISSDGEIFVSNLQRVRRDVTEASRLYTSQAVADFLESWPDKKIWIDDIIRDIQKALNDIGLSIETVRVSGDDGGTVGLRRKFQWALSHQKKLVSKQQHLMLCHQSLMSAVQLMQTAEMNATFDPIYELPAPKRSYSEDSSREIFHSPYSRQKWRMNQRNSSVPSITISEPGETDNKIVQPYLYALAELPGSTPEELHRHDRDMVDAARPRSQSFSDGSFPSTQRDPRPPSFPNHTRSMQLNQRPATANESATGTRNTIAHRRSLDNARPPISVLDDRARASFDMARPRAYSSEQVRPRRSFEVRNRASHEQVRPMPTLTERPIERFNSTASVAVGDAVSVPLSMMRYRSRPVNVRKPLEKHHSLPSKLPQFQSQTSLLDDLSTWVIPQSARESYRSVQSVQSTDTSASIVTSTPATSVTQSPIAPKFPTSHATIIIDAGTVLPPPISNVSYVEQDATTSSPVSISPNVSRDEKNPNTSSPVSPGTIPALPSRPAPPPPIPPKIPLDPPPKPRPSIPTNQPPQAEPETPSILEQFLHRSGSAPIPPPLSRRRRPGPRPKKPSTVDNSAESVPPISIQQPTSPSDAELTSTKMQAEQPASSPSNPPDTTTPPSNSSPNDPTTPAPVAPSPPSPPPSPKEPSVHKNALHHLTSSASATDKYPIAFAPSSAPPVPGLPSPYMSSSAVSPPISSLSVQAVASAAASVETLASDASASARPMTAVAKRRAAHARRMQLAFESSTGGE